MFHMFEKSFFQFCFLSHFSETRMNLATAQNLSGNPQDALETYGEAIKWERIVDLLKKDV